MYVCENVYVYVRVCVSVCMCVSVCECVCGEVRAEFDHRRKDIIVMDSLANDPFLDNPRSGLVVETDWEWRYYNIVGYNII